MRLTEVGAQRFIDDAVLEPPASRTPIDVLIVDDNLNDADLTTHALKESILPERIKAVHDGAEALDFIFCRGDYVKRDPRQQPKLILLDLQLPKVEGLEVLRRIRQDPRTQDIPVVIFTTSKEDRNIIAGYKLGANSFLVKRQDFDEFVKGIEALGVYWLAMNKPAVNIESQDAAA